MSFTSSVALTRSRWGDVTLVALAQLLGGMGIFLVGLTQILAFEERGAAGYEVAALVICEALPMVVLGKPIGWLVDRVDSRALLVIVGILQAVACLAVAQATSVPAVLGGMLALATVSAVSMPTRQALLPAIVVRDDLPRAGAIGQTAGSIGMMAGPALAGFLYGGLGPQATIRVAAGIFLVTVVSAIAIRTRRGGRANVASPAEAFKQATVDGSVSWTLRRDAVLRASIWGLACVTTAISAVNVVLVFFVMGTLGSPPEGYGAIEASWMLGMLVGGWLVGLTVRPTTTDAVVAKRLVLSAGVICLGIVALSSAQSPWWLLPCYLVGGAGNAALNVFGVTLLGRRVPAPARGRASAALVMRVQGGSLIGFVIGGLLLSVAAPRWIALGCGVLGVLVVLAVRAVLTRVLTRAGDGPGTGTGGAAADPSAATAAEADGSAPPSPALAA